MVWAD